MSTGDPARRGPRASSVRAARSGGPVRTPLATVLQLDGGTAPADIAVLYRARTQGAGVLAALLGDGIPLHTEDVGLLRTGRGPELALGYLRAAASDDPVSFDEAWSVVWAPDLYIQKEAFAAQVKGPGREGLLAVARARELALASGQGPGALRAFAALARPLTTMRGWATAAEALDLLVDEEAYVRVCTIHKAKGREWRRVFLPGLLEGACPAEQRGQIVGTVEAPEGIPQSPWIEQERRIFYVGVTRAMDVAYLHAPPPEPSRFVDEL